MLPQHEFNNPWPLGDDRMFHVPKMLAPTTEPSGIIYVLRCIYLTYVHPCAVLLNRLSIYLYIIIVLQPIVCCIVCCHPHPKLTPSLFVPKTLA